MSFTQAIPNVRYAQTQYGDTLQRIALRELGDASQWVNLALLNNLAPPYIVDSQSEARPGLLVAGAAIAVPAPVPQASVTTDPDAVFLRDIRLSNGLLTASNGSLAVAGGLDNFKQALLIRLRTLMQELLFHPDYGCWVSSLRGAGNDAASGQVAAFYVQSALLQDERVAAVPRCTATVNGAAMAINATLNPVTGRQIDIKTVI